MFRCLKKLILTTAAAAVLATPAHAGIATVGAAHDYVQKKWGVEIPRAHADSNIINMRYLMQLVDRANFMINWAQTSDFTNDEKYATGSIVGKDVAKQAIDKLIEKIKFEFFFTPETNDNEYSFSMNATGRFLIDWGDGEREFFMPTKTGRASYSHTYKDSASNYEISLGGKATGYSPHAYDATISFSDTNSHIRNMRGCLGCIFSTLESGGTRQPHFYSTFYNNKALDCEIPENLFDGIEGAPMNYMFTHMFNGCSELRGRIPENLFSGINGAPTLNMFNSTFAGCKKLTGPIPEKLFAGLDGPAAQGMFYSTFSNCTGLTGPSAKIGDKYLYEIWTDVPSQGTYSGAKQLSDYACIPVSWGGAGTKQPGECEPEPQEPEAGFTVDTDDFAAAGDGIN